MIQVLGLFCLILVDMRMFGDNENFDSFGKVLEMWRVSNNYE